MNPASRATVFTAKPSGADASLRIVDTGGILPEDKDFIPAEIFRQAKVALEEADAVIMVVDGRTEMASPDIELARQLIRSGKPLFLAVNKVDTEKQQSLTRRVSSSRNPQAVSYLRRKRARPR